VYKTIIINIVINVTELAQHSVWLPMPGTFNCWHSIMP